MKYITRIVFIALIVMSGIVSCKKDKSTAPDLGYTYFPNEVGTFVIYNVDSISYAHVPTTIDTFRYQLKEKIESIYTDGQNRPTIRLERYIRNYNPSIPYSALPWQLRNVWSENRTATTAEKVEENSRFIKLIFPVKRESTWDGNIQNTNGTINYVYAFVDQSRTIGSIGFDSVLQVTQQDVLTLISQQKYIEKYARHVGLVSKQVIDVNSQPNPNWSNPLLFPNGNDSLAAFYARPILTRVTSGVQYTYTVYSYGIE
jgi:hypothetical protein